MKRANVSILIVHYSLFIVNFKYICFKVLQMKTGHINILTLIICCGICFFHTTTFCQTNWAYSTNVNVGANIFLTNIFDKAVNRGYKFPGMRIYAGMSASASKGRFILNYGPSVSIYSKTIGSNLNRFVDDFQIYFINSFGIGYASRDRVNYTKHLRTMHNGDYYNLSLIHI